MPTDNDPRVFFAAERTLLAWLRTSIGMIALGFVVARFGLFLQLVRSHADPSTPAHLPSAVLGVMMSLAGALTAGVATWQQRRYYQTLGPADMPPRYHPGVAVVLGSGVTIAGLVLALELILTKG
jgi:putative membrane protein